MLFVYASRTNNIRRIVEKLDLNNALEIDTGSELVDEPFVLFTYTDLFGEVPDVVASFLSNNSRHLKAVAGSGNKNFGANFCKAAHIISNHYKVEILIKFDLGGNLEAIAEFKAKLLNLGCN